MGDFVPGWFGPVGDLVLGDYIRLDFILGDLVRERKLTFDYLKNSSVCMIVNLY